MASIFTNIINGKIPCYKVAETTEYLAFLDINPLAKGHTLVIPKIEVDYIYDLDDNILAGLNIFAKSIGLAIEKVVPCKRIGIAVIGLEVPHAHIHLVPINGVYDIDFSKPRVELTQDEFTTIAANIASHV